MIAPLTDEARAVIAPLVDAAPPLDAEKIAELRLALGVDS